MKYSREFADLRYRRGSAWKALALGALYFLFPCGVWAQAVPVFRAKNPSLWEALHAGGFVMIPLAVLSILTLGLILIYLFALRKRNIVSERFMHTADALIRKQDHLGLLAITNRHNESIARVIQRVLEFLTQYPGASTAEAREIAETEGSRQVAALNQQVIFLADIGTLAPMLGLLGTIFGMIKSFGAVAGSAASARATFLAQGIAEALIATATGLIIGIVAMAAYSYFRGRVQALTSELEGASTQLLATLVAHRSSHSS
ncbi:MAG: MotA/TolQ/ExbB proton channel family protein [Verrucomicrobia bacterium]|nr:MAG: MotA/TolQ/ExbB proton channel family protein [Verrucomicrobiota bacterium]